MDGWKEYRDEKLGFMVSYPESVYQAKFMPGKGLILRNSDYPKELYEISIVSLSKEFEEVKDKFEWVKEIKIGGLLGKKRYYLSNVVIGNVLEVRVRVGKKLIQLVQTRADDKDAVDRFEKIIRTFRVIQ